MTLLPSRGLYLSNDYYGCDLHYYSRSCDCSAAVAADGQPRQHAHELDSADGHSDEVLDCDGLVVAVDASMARTGGTAAGGRICVGFAS